jgi:HSP20 family protein
MLTRFFANGIDVESTDRSMAWSPRVDVSETDKAMVVKADLPGVKPEDIEVTIADGTLALRGDRREETKEEKENLKRTERFQGAFYRAIPLGNDFDAERITAQIAKGVVTITVPRKPGAQPRKIAVQAAG